MSSSPFLSLPSELRIEIYKALLELNTDTSCLRLVCHQIKGEYDDEITRYMNDAVPKLLAIQSATLPVGPLSTFTNFRQTRHLSLEIPFPSAWSEFHHNAPIGIKDVDFIGPEAILLRSKHTRTITLHYPFGREDDWQTSRLPRVHKHERGVFFKYSMRNTVFEQIYGIATQRSELQKEKGGCRYNSLRTIEVRWVERDLHYAEVKMGFEIILSTDGKIRGCEFEILE